MIFRSPIILAYHLRDVAEELRVRESGPPGHMECSYGLSLYLDDLTRIISGSVHATRAPSYTDERAYTAFAQTMVGMSGYFGFRRHLPDLHSVVGEIAWFAQDLSFLSLRGYKSDRGAIAEMHRYVTATIPRIADLPHFRRNERP